MRKLKLLTDTENDHLNMVDLKSDQNAHYFQYLNSVFKRVMSFYQSTTHGGEANEVKLIEHYLRLFLNTIVILRYKYLYDADSAMRIDTTFSGYPNSLEFTKLDADLMQAKERLKSFPSEQDLKGEILNRLMTKHEDPKDLLQVMGERLYFKALSEQPFFRSYNRGDLALIGENADIRQFLYHWAIFDSEDSRPFIYLMMFDQQKSAPDLREDEAARRLFEQAVKDESFLARELVLIGRGIDRKIKAVSPKLLKRIEIGPILGEYSNDDHVLTNLIRDPAMDKGEFGVPLTVEMLVSAGEADLTGSFLKTDKIVQQFHVETSDFECSERGVSAVKNFLICSHHLAQKVTAEHKDFARRLSFPIHSVKPISIGTNAKSQERTPDQGVRHQEA